MINVTLFSRTLSGFEASLVRGESGTLYQYCKTHHVNYQGLRYWMKKQSIALPVHDHSKVVGSPIPATRQLIPLTILSPEERIGHALQSAHLRQVSITLPKGVVVGIGEISPADLASLICHIGQ